MLGVLSLSGVSRITTVRAMVMMPIRIVYHTGRRMERMAFLDLRHVALATAARRRVSAMPSMFKRRAVRDPRTLLRTRGLGRIAHRGDRVIRMVVMDISLRHLRYGLVVFM
jgi:hypothetical protein